MLSRTSHLHRCVQQPWTRHRHACGLGVCSSQQVLQLGDLPLGALQALAQLGDHARQALFSGSGLSLCIIAQPLSCIRLQQ